MKLKLLFVFLFLISFQTFAQDKKWSIETNYSIIPADGLGGGDNIIDFGLKYRVINTEFLNAGVSLNAGYLTNRSYTLGSSSEETVFIFQPRVFAEFNLPFSEKLRPSLGLGYSYFSELNYRPESVKAFNFNFGLTYDISEKWFIQLHYDFVDLKSINYGEGYNNIRLGVGFRF